MTPDVLFLDIEGTGLDTANDRIVELCLFPVEGELRVRRINPGVPIPAESTAVHGITDEDVKDCPLFRQVAASVQRLIEGKVLCGYSLRRYDTLILDAELRRAGQPGFPRDAEGRLAVQEIDLYELWHRHEPRTLVAFLEKFAGIKLEDAHSADADTRYLPQGLEGFRRAHGLEEATIEKLCALSVPDGEVDRDRKFLRRADGVVTFNFGQSRGMPVHEDEGLLRWVLRKDFSEESKAYARQFLAEFFPPEAECDDRQEVEHVLSL